MASPFQAITIYENASRFFLVGSDVHDDRFSVLKIDRTDSKELMFSNENHEYTKKELNELLSMLSNVYVPSKSSASSNVSALTVRVNRAKGILGFVRFLEGYYMIVITKAVRVAQIGFHAVYKIEDTETVYVPGKTDGQNTADEQRYLKLFQTVDLATNFYFSYTYDLTRTLQSNITDEKSRPCGSVEKYVWNSYLMEPMTERDLNSRWLLPVVHGFVGASTISIKGFTFNVTLVARRSNKFAGTRFLKRGANDRGYAANEVETEQIVADTSVTSFERGRFTSFVQLRGSVPLVWSQDLAKVVGKPPIQLDVVDPFAVIPSLHFQELRWLYGSPIVVVNLVKRERRQQEKTARERRQQESILNDELYASISYLNQFLYPEEAIYYLSFDMARCHKAAGPVLTKLEEIGYNILKLNGWFQTFPSLYFHHIRPSQLVDESPTLILQNGVPRTNCVDCLDRTNVAQFIIGKVALSYQLYALGLLHEPRLSLDTEICRVLESLYEQHGDTLALQYAGSQLVHSIRTYKKIALFQERSRDVIQTISRYYSNTFGDYEKQNAINLFLGVFRPASTKTHLWELPNDVALHNNNNNTSKTMSLNADVDYCAWYELPPNFVQNRIIELPIGNGTNCDQEDETNFFERKLNDFDRFYRTYEMSYLDALIVAEQRVLVHIDSTTSPPTSSVQPFMRLWKRQQDAALGNNNLRARPRRKSAERKSTSKKHTGGKQTNGIDDESSSDEGETVAHADAEIRYSPQFYDAKAAEQKFLKIASQIMINSNTTTQATAKFAPPSMRLVYGTEIKPPGKKDAKIYERYAKMAAGSATTGAAVDDIRRSVLQRQRQDAAFDISQRRRHYFLPPFFNDAALSVFTADSSFGVEPPVVSETARQKYNACVACARRGPKSPLLADMEMYAAYARKYEKVVRGGRP